VIIDCDFLFWTTLYKQEIYLSQFPTAFESMLPWHEQGAQGRLDPCFPSGSPKYPSLQYSHRWPKHIRVRNSITSLRIPHIIVVASSIMKHLVTTKYKLKMVTWY